MPSKLAAIRSVYLVPAARGGRVRLPSGKEGTIMTGRGNYIWVRLDGEKRPRAYHPVRDGLVYLKGEAKEG